MAKGPDNDQNYPQDLKELLTNPFEYVNENESCRDYRIFGHGKVDHRTHAKNALAASV